MTIELTEKDKRFLALAIQGLTLTRGWSAYADALVLAKKLGIEAYFQEYLQQEYLQCETEAQRKEVEL